MEPRTIVLYFEENHDYRMHPYHLGTDLGLARRIAAEKFEALNKVGDFVKTAILKQHGETVDTFDGAMWFSERDYYGIYSNG